MTVPGEKEMARLRKATEDLVPPGEQFSFWTHAVGALVALVGMVFLILRADGVVAVTAHAVYGSTLVFLFTASAMHHVPWFQNHGLSGALRRLDHIAIYAFIAGSYTPICLLALDVTIGVPLLVGVWGFGITGIVLKIVRPLAPRWVTVGFYIAMGWTAVLAAPWMVRSFPWHALALLAAGGVLYTVGAVVYASERPNPFPRVMGFHGLWHVFVLVAAGLHYAFIYGFVPPA